MPRTRADEPVLSGESNTARSRNTSSTASSSGRLTATHRGEGGDHGLDTEGRRFRQVVFPEAEHDVSLFLELTGVSGVAVAVALDLGRPVRPVHRPDVAAPRAAVPVAPIEKDDHLRLGEQEVRLAGEPLRVEF